MLSRLKGIETGNTCCVLSGGCLRLWICFPVWRELKRYGLTNCFLETHPLWICFPVWRELKLDSGVKCFINVHTLDMLSRLKGIETWRNRESFLIEVVLWICFPVWRELKLCFEFMVKNRGTNFGYAFPFEGNWNVAPLGDRQEVAQTFGYAFPFEGNWNSRSPIFGWSPFWYFGYAFPFEGNWNLLSVMRPYQHYQQSLDMLSRLKGIETLWCSHLNPHCIHFGYAFPFEGNWNDFSITDSFHAGLHVFGYGFPFEGNWNLIHSAPGETLISSFGYAFPFEGNWNNSHIDRVRSGFPRNFGYGFPFEGNWNFAGFV